MLKRVGALALILSSAAILQPTAAFAQDGWHRDGGYHDRDHDRSRDRHEWREHEHREWRGNEGREWRQDRNYRAYDRGYRGGSALYGVGPTYGYYESAPTPYYYGNPYCPR